jgi:antitoxin component of MazEF toxin-antitoxin module
MQKLNLQIGTEIEFEKHIQNDTIILYLENKNYLIFSINARVSLA